MKCQQQEEQKRFVTPTAMPNTHAHTHIQWQRTCHCEQSEQWQRDREATYLPLHITITASLCSAYIHINGEEEEATEEVEAKD